MYEILNFFKNSFYLIAFLFLLLSLFLYFNQNKMIYMPEVINMCTKDISANPASLKSPQESSMLFEELKIKTKDNLQLYGWFIYQKENALKKPTFVYFHENAGSKKI